MSVLQDFSRESDVVSVDDIRSLPHRASIAFAARCARKCEYKTWGVSEESDRRAVAKVIGGIERLAAGDPIDLESADFARAKEQVRDLEERQFEDEARASSHAGQSVLAAYSAAISDRGEHFLPVTNAVNEASYSSFRWVNDPAQRRIYPAKLAIQREFEFLRNTAREKAWNDESPVAPKFFALDESIEKRVVLAINDMCVDLCTLIAESQKALDFLEWRQLEEVVATALDGLGFGIELTPPSKDGGKDVIATCVINGKLQTYYIEIKHWRSGKAVGVAPVRDFVEVNIRDETHGGMFLSTSGYTREIHSVISEIEQRRIRLGNDETVVSLCQRFVSQQGRATWQALDVLPLVDIGFDKLE